MIDGHGNDLYHYEGLVRADFSSNIYQGLDLSGLKSHLSQRLDLIRCYPAPAPLMLERVIAEHRRVNPSNVMVTAGATDAIYLVARSLQFDDKGEPYQHVIAQPTFSEYADACRLCGISPLTNADGIAGRKVHWLCNPNNPTGSHIAANELLERAYQQPKDVFMIDQSYWQYCEETTVDPIIAVALGNIILINSFSKDYGVPGLRLGCLFGSYSLVKRIRQYRQPWSISALDIEAGLYLENDGDSVRQHIHSLISEAQRLRNELTAIDGIKVHDTLTNFMLCRISVSTAAELKDYLVREHGLLIRDASNFVGLDNHCFRVAAQSFGVDNQLISAIKGYIAQRESSK